MIQNLKLTALAIMACALSQSSIAHAQEAVQGRCKTYHWKPGDVITVEAQRYKATHVTLPEEALDVVLGPKELWDLQFIKNNVFVIPQSTAKQGKETTASVVGISGNSYEFLFVQVDSMRTHCVIVSQTGNLIERRNWDTKDNALQAQVQVLQQQLVKANADKAAVAAEAQRQTMSAVKSYRAALSSNYEWDDGRGWFGKSAIESVQDDGRFTYIRLKDDTHGIMSILAEVDGEPEILEKVYDASKREYRIAGIYPKFTLRAGKSEMTITRKGM